MGKILKMDNLLNLKVAGIVEDAKVNTDLPLKIMVSYVTVKQHLNEYNYNDNWGAVSSNYKVFMQSFAADWRSPNKIDVQLKRNVLSQAFR